MYLLVILYLKCFETPLSKMHCQARITIGNNLLLLLHLTVRSFANGFLCVCVLLLFFCRGGGLRGRACFALQLNSATFDDFGPPTPTPHGWMVRGWFGLAWSQVAFLELQKECVGWGKFHPACIWWRFCSQGGKNICPALQISLT